MKTLSQLMENFDSNPGNPLGVTNHLTPIYNIISNVRNLFGMRLGVIVEPGEDGLSLKLHSSKFVSPKEINKLLDEPFNNNGGYYQSWEASTLRSYIISQGLTEVKLVNLGMYYVVYFSPNDIRAAQNPDCMAASECPACTTCSEMKDMNLSECEIDSILLEGADDEEELEDKTAQELLDVLKDEDKIRAAKKFSELISKEMELPEEYYFKAVKDQEGHESIALRFKSEKRRPFGKTVDVIVSLLNIYGSGDEAVWVDGFDNKESLPEEQVKLIENILRFIRAHETDDACVWKIYDSVEEEEKNAKEEDKSKDDEKKDEENPVDQNNEKEEGSEEKKDDDKKDEDTAVGDFSLDNNNNQE